MEELWKKNLSILKEKISPQNFDTWIRPLRIAAADGNTIFLSVPNKFFKDWITENYLSSIHDSLSRVVGVEVNINLVVNKAEIAPSAEDNSGKQIRQPSTSQPVTQHRIHPSLNPNYSFDRFVVGASNQFAHAASVAVAKQPARAYNPLFIYGGVGLGKTHLLNAIGLLTANMYPNTNVLYVSAEEFMNELINSIRYDRMSKFREKYRKIDSLLIDDIQFIAGKERTQEEFFHTFNTLHDSGKQIVVTSDKFPKEIPNLEERLRSRFEWGLIADIQPPEIETRVAIIEKKAQENSIVLPGSVAYYIASNATNSNIRELEGFLTRIAAFSSLTSREIDMNLVKEVLRKVLKQSEGKSITVDEIIKTVTEKFNIKTVDIKSQKKSKNLVLPRQIAMYLSRKLTRSSFPDIGAKIGGRDHSTVIYAYNKIAKLIERDETTRKIVQEIERSLLNYSSQGR
ncbi:MAG: chromosomal replication initiator protein DnaA [Deltaproteobacteria bacterium]|nr:chromosomal replication initiator protein DnaA [Deltaproteobacteria bacterium]